MENAAVETKEQQEENKSKDGPGIRGSKFSGDQVPAESLFLLLQMLAANPQENGRKSKISARKCALFWLFFMVIFVLPLEVVTVCLER